MDRTTDHFSAGAIKDLMAPAFLRLNLIAFCVLCRPFR